ncbi:MAG: tRNA uridine-5-carboxymethylaminomethyl(34) synthesis GTPase MnmE [Treponema sp.]|uniref:tRNA uridine-5-carboxymethylaminomethyl(34) synthesis GTPase MnmE n=1 Tax=Treponema sp. TaxID=166 RepID=UPI0025CFCE47|nr:tRNA uridine-5-carboxymethylaminomethyl(34) synthesis GTPase MnmE [Treponema sp.]MBQ8678616.1 tRNA uridine-5-carboxymethylaminomethyl(34) synthesis GTPase MnmE [Treponema sp.]MBR1403774.1 tRNA uridine-5-carboxymethylaminomethyl(34) synthesis GTPase MnmE [Treponema sp.]
MTNLKYTPEEPIAAIATALAPAALGIVRCSGKNCIELFSKIFSRPKALLEAEGNTIVYGWILETENGKRKIDEVLVSVFRAPKSFTGEDMVEISCHGGVHVVQTVYNLLLQNGFRAAEKGEFTFRAYINGKADLTKAEAVREIIDSKTDASQSRAAGRLAGNLYETIDGVKKQIVDTLAAIEVEIEYPEDEETIADSFDASELKSAERTLCQLADSWKSEKIYQDGARVVLCGRTNAGKSSLFNALLKEDRAIVSDIAGTTRDFIESWIDFSGIPARLFDTAGLRETDDVIEAIGVERTKDLSEDADLILYLVDATVGLTDEDKAFISAVPSSLPIILVWNKADKLDGALPAHEEYDSIRQVEIAAKKGSGLGDLSEAIKQALSRSSATTDGGTALGSERQKVSVEKALDCVRHALSLTEDYALDAVVQDLEDCLDALGEVTGDVTPEDVLDSIFSHFCVGK